MSVSENLMWEIIWFGVFWTFVAGGIGWLGGWWAGKANRK